MERNFTSENDVYFERKLGGLTLIKGWLEKNHYETWCASPDFKRNIALERLVIECKNFVTITKGIFGEADILMEVCALYHDIGRVFQYDVLRNFDDEKISHNALGLDSLDRFIEANKIKITPDIQVLRDVIYYHGKNISGSTKISEKSRKYIEAISTIEIFDWECIREISNFERIIEGDYRKYNKEYPEYVGKVREEIFSLFKARDYKARKYFLKSYAEEIIVSIMKVMSLINKYGDIARRAMIVPNYYYASALAGYNHLIHKYMSEDIAYEVELILRKECYTPIKHTIIPDDENFKGSGEKFLEEIFDFLRRKGIEKLPKVEKGESKKIESDDFWELSLINLDGSNMCFLVKYFSLNSMGDKYTTRFTIS